MQEANLLIFIVEDDGALARGIAFALQREGYCVRIFGTCRRTLEALKTEKPDLVLLDWNLPDGDGLELCGHIRSSCDAPVLMITARDMEIDQVMCLESGADDYIAKPFSLAVLHARINALLRRRGQQRGSGGRQLVSGPVRLDEGTLQVYKNDEAVDLSLTEFRLLKLFLEHKNQVLLKEQILEHIWDSSGAFVEENTLMVNIRRLRMKLEENPSRPRLIRTVHGMGYLWEERSADR